MVYKFQKRGNFGSGSSGDRGRGRGGGFQKRDFSSSSGSQSGGFQKKGESTGGRFGDKGSFSKNGPKEDNSSESRMAKCIENDAMDAKYGFERLKDWTEQVGWLLNMHTTEILDEDKRLISAVDYYFLQEDGSRFKTTLAYRPYFYVLPKTGYEKEVMQYILKKFGGYVAAVDIVSKEDLDLPNHLVGLKQIYLKLSFHNINDLLRVRKDILPAVKKNREREKSNTSYADMLRQSYIGDMADAKQSATDHMENIIDIREYDVPYHVRVSIDLKIFVGLWYSVKAPVGSNNHPIITRRTDIIESPDAIVLAYDIETTKLPLKFPDAATDQIMMISYMLDGLGYLITNRDIVSADVEDFEYTPRPEFEGKFTIFNEANEEALIKKFFDHILDVKPNIFVTYNGDFFDWAFVEARATIHGLSMVKEIGFSVVRDGVYSCRPCIHMDCFNWVQRDSYLPVGSQNLKAVAKAKLRYDPVELDPEEMCRMAAEQPDVLSNYSVSDAVATYYLYMKYVHPFIFALCTIIPMEPDEVLRKGSGTLCEALLMVEAFHVNVIFPNKQESILNKMTNDGHVLDSETYVGGHVEALESGVFRADIPCRFRLVSEAFTELMETVEKTLKHSLEEEEHIPIDQVLNLEEVATEIKNQLMELRDNPVRTENPVIYHLDVAAMYPNIILTNRLQPSAMVDEAVCAACDFNKPGAKCQREMAWTWRGEYIPASKSEFQRIQQQLEMEKFPPIMPGGPQRQFHELNKEDRAAFEKKRLQEYSRKAYRKTHMTRIEERYQTVCQQENSFYVDTVRAFRDRRYEYKGLCKTAKKQVSDAIEKGDPSLIKSAKNREILYDSLQLAHKCILNSFYGYVMRKGARWHSMEMAGIVCHTGGNIIRKAREIVEKVGRPLELDTDGIWCILPSSFPENFVIKTKIPKKEKITVSYPNAVLNIMVKEEFTNTQYHDLKNADTLQYEIKNENSIFFEVDGPYLAMILPAAKEEGKRLKKRYAVFNYDRSLAELKGFEVKRRGELQLIKNFQSSVFEAFLMGDSLETCYEAVARVADYWLDVLYTKAATMPDVELFELISENRSMSRKLEDYGAQKSTSISTAKRLAEFLGDQMVKDAGLSCRFIISKKPDGAPVTERAIPLAIFQAEEPVKKHYLRRWLKDNSMVSEEDFDIRTILDWNYYIERLGGTIQKIITIPAALQGVNNPVVRVAHPDWLHKRMLEKTDILKQRKINELFKRTPKTFEISESNENGDENNDDVADDDIADIEEIGSTRKKLGKIVVVHSKRRKRDRSPDIDLKKPWRTFLGPPPPMGHDAESIEAWVSFHKEKWAYQKKQRNEQQRIIRENEDDGNNFSRNAGSTPNRTSGPVSMAGFLRRAQRTLLDTPWQVIQLMETGQPGVFKLWALVGSELHKLRLVVPRIFYLNSKEPKPDGPNHRKIIKILPRAQPSYNLYEYCIPEELYRQTCNEIDTDIATNPNIDGIYETQMPLIFRAITQLGCVCTVDRVAARKFRDVGDTFELDQLNFRDSIKDVSYMDLSVIKHIYIYHHKCGKKALVAIFFPATKKATIIALDTVKTSQMPNLVNFYNAVRNDRLAKGDTEDNLPEANYTFDIKIENDAKQVFRYVHYALEAYKDEKRGATFLAIQSQIPFATWVNAVPIMGDYPMVPIHIQDVDTIYNVMDWQRIGCRMLFTHFLRLKAALTTSINHSRYLHIPVGNLPLDATLYGCDLVYARHLMKNNFVLWCSLTERPDLGGKEADDNRLITEFEEQNSIVINHPGCYQSVCVELELDSLAVNTLLQAHHVHDIEGTCATVAFDNMPTASLEEMMGNAPGPSLASYDETALCSSAFRILRAMVSTWLRDVTINRNQLADYQLISLYRWLRSPNVLLYDPALRKTLNNLMKKLFIQLVAELMRLGAIIVYADFSKIIICTKKNRVADALGYVEYITASIKNKELFHIIDIKMKNCWEYMIWLDVANFSGIKGKVASVSAITPEDSKVKKKKSKSKPKLKRKNKHSEDDSDDQESSENSEESEEEEEEEEENSDLEELNLSDDEDELEIEMQWAIVNYLPDVGNCKMNFKTVVASYMLAVHKHLANELDGFTPGQTPVRRRKGSQTPRRQHNNPILLNTAQFSKNLVKGDLTQSLFGIVQSIDRKYPTYVRPKDDGIPTYSFLALNKYKPALEFVKAVHKVLSLDTNIEDEAYKLRRNMLKLIGVGEFSEEAQWRDPTVSIILPEVICKVCNECRDIDLCKDPNVDISSPLPSWICPTCKAKYDTAEIELNLVETVNRKLMAYVLQDLQCRKCQQVKEDNMKTRCVCAGSLKTVIEIKQTMARLRSYKEIAQHFGMPLLLQNVNWVLQMSPFLTHPDSIEKL